MFYSQVSLQVMRSSQVLNAMRPASGPHFGDWPTRGMRFTGVCFPQCVLHVGVSIVMGVPQNGWFIL